MVMICNYFSKARCLLTVPNRLQFYLTLKTFPLTKMNEKPPNILVYTGTNCPQRFKEVEESLLKCLNIDSYVIYHLLLSEINKSPWMENSLLLVVSSDIVEDTVSVAFETYLKNFGNILFTCSKINSCFMGSNCIEVREEDSLIEANFKDIEKLHIFRGRYSYESKGIALCWDKFKKCLIQKIIYNKNILIMSEIYLDKDPKISLVNYEEHTVNRHIILKDILIKEFELCAKPDDNIPQLTPGYFISDRELQKATVKNSLKFNDIALAESLFNECKVKNLDEEIKMPIYYYHKNTSKNFDFDEDLYFSNLHTDMYGHQLIYFSVTTTTMEVARQFSDYEGIVIAAGSQISGKGRRSNKWISPKGCAMFTLHFSISLCSNLGKRISLLQHIASLAVVHGIKSQQMYKDLELQIKWPNDIYHGTIKLGGLIVTTVLQKDLAHVDVGWGINIANKYPTSCINDIIVQHNSKYSTSLPYLHVEELMASTISQMEYFVKDFIKFGSENFLTYYYQYWMHKNQRVTLKESSQEGVIVGIDEYGYLKISTNDSGIITFQPDGNRFDIMKNLIYPA